MVRLVMAGESFIITDDLTGEPIAELVPASDKDDFSNTPEDEM